MKSVRQLASLNGNVRKVSHFHDYGKQVCMANSKTMAGYKRE
jgi:hypothetical protein